MSESTVRRRRDELIALLAAKAPRLDRALKKAAKLGKEVILIDGTLIPAQRRTGKANRQNYSGKHHHHGLTPTRTAFLPPGGGFAAMSPLVGPCSGGWTHSGMTGDRSQEQE